MSVDYYSCDCCGDARYEEYVRRCEKCGKNVCDDCVVGEEDFDDMLNDDGELKSEHCPFCNGDKVDDEDLLCFVLDKYLNISYEELKKEYLENKKGEI